MKIPTGQIHPVRRDLTGEVIDPDTPITPRRGVRTPGGVAPGLARSHPITRPRPHHATPPPAPAALVAAVRQDFERLAAIEAEIRVLPSSHVQSIRDIADRELARRQRP